MKTEANGSPVADDAAVVAPVETTPEHGNAIAKASNNSTDVAPLDTSEIKVEIPSNMDFDAIDEMEVGFSAIPKYRTQEDWMMLKDKPVRCIFLGYKEIPNDKGEAILAAAFAEKTGIFLAAQKMLIDGVRPFPIHSFVLITFTGKKKNVKSEGSTNIFEVNLLKPKNQTEQDDHVEVMS